MHSLSAVPLNVSLPPLNTLIQRPPSKWQGRTIEWKNERELTPVFINRFELHKEAYQSDIYLLGIRYEIADAVIHGLSLSKGFFIEYVILEKIVNEIKVHRLLQQLSSTFSDVMEKKDYLRASEVKNPGKVSLFEEPKWVKSEAFWPTLENVPMLFIGQIELPETEISRSFLTWGEVLFLFWMREEGVSKFKIVTQAAKFQSAESHYRNEEKRMRKKGM